MTEQKYLPADGLMVSVTLNEKRKARFKVYRYRSDGDQVIEFQMMSQAGTEDWTEQQFNATPVMLGNLLDEGQLEWSYHRNGFAGNMDTMIGMVKAAKVAQTMAEEMLHG